MQRSTYETLMQYETDLGRMQVDIGIMERTPGLSLVAWNRLRDVYLALTEARAELVKDLSRFVDKE